MLYEQHNWQDVKLQPNVTKSQEHRLIQVWSPPSSRYRLGIEIWYQAEIAPIIENLDFMDILYLDTVLPSLWKVK